jgi:hypothetical protein
MWSLLQRRPLSLRPTAWSHKFRLFVQRPIKPSPLSGQHFEPARIECALCSEFRGGKGIWHGQGRRPELMMQP